MNTETRAYVLEDEEKARNSLMSLLDEYCPTVTVVGSSDNLSEALKDICTMRPNLLFFDVNISEKGNSKTSFELLQKLPDYQHELIFITAHQEYALDAFRANAIDYLLKPISIKELVSAVDRCTEKLQWDGLKSRLPDLIDGLGEKNDVKRIWIHSIKEVIPVDLNRVIRVEAQGKCTDFFCTDKKVTSSKNIGEYAGILLKEGMLQVHRSHIINPKEIMSYHKQDGGWVVMSDRKEVPVSRKSREKLLNILR